MTISITKQFTFDAAHSLPDHDGKCRNLHGHSYVFEVTVSGPIIETGPKKGMIMDFADISHVVKEEILSKWDHQFLNDVVPFVTTAENLATEIFKILKKKLPVTGIRLWETKTSYVQVSE